MLRQIGFAWVSHAQEVSVDRLTHHLDWMEQCQLGLGLLFGFALVLLQERMLNLGLHFRIQQVEPLDGAALLRREVEVVVTVVSILTHALHGQLTSDGRGFASHHTLDVLLDPGSRVESHVHNVQVGLARLLHAQSGAQLALCHVARVLCVVNSDLGQEGGLVCRFHAKLRKSEPNLQRFDFLESFPHRRHSLVQK